MDQIDIKRKMLKNESDIQHFGMNTPRYNWKPVLGGGRCWNWYWKAFSGSNLRMRMVPRCSENVQAKITITVTTSIYSCML